MRFLTTEEVQNRLRISRSTLYAWMATGRLKPIRVPDKRGLLFKENEIMNVLGVQPTTGLWVFDQHHQLNGARSLAGRTNPAFIVEFIGEPRPERLRLKIVSSQDGFSPNADSCANYFIDQRDRYHSFVFVGNATDAWKIDSALVMRDELGSPYTEVWLVRN